MDFCQDGPCFEPAHMIHIKIHLMADFSNLFTSWRERGKVLGVDFLTSNDKCIEHSPCPKSYHEKVLSKTVRHTNVRESESVMVHNIIFAY